MQIEKKKKNQVITMFGVHDLFNSVEKHIINSIFRNILGKLWDTVLFVMDSQGFLIN